MLPSDPNVVAFLAAQNTLRGLQTTHRLMHMAGSFGRPGSLTEGGRRYRQTAERLGELSLIAIIYAAQRGWCDIADVQFGAEPFAIDEPVDWYVAKET